MARKRTNGKKINSDTFWGCCPKSAKVWGILLIAIGIFYLLRDIGFISYRISIWTIILVFLGLYLVFKR